MPSTNFTTLRIVLQNGSQRAGIIGQEGGLQKSAEVLIKQEKLCFGNYRLVQTVSFSTLENLLVLLRPRAVFAARPDSNSVNQRRNISVIGALPRMFSTPSVSGTSFQVCGYHIDRAFSDPNQLSASGKKLSASSKIQNSPMATCGSRAVFGNFRLDNLSTHCGEISFSLNNAGSFCINRNFNHCRKASMSLKEKPNNYLFYGFAIYHTAKRRCDFSPCIDSGLRGLHTSSFTCFSTGTAPDMSFDNTAREEQLASSAVSSEQKIPAGSTLKLLSGSCYLPHPDKEETGGEDAHFICVDEQAIGVADGVGGWADLGVDAGIFSRELMSNSVSAIQEEPKGSIDPARVLEKAHSSTKAEGSSTACIIALTDQGLHAINLGDSGFMVVRDGCTIFRSPVQQHDFNFTYQLESGNNGDLPSSGQVFTIPVAPGDVIIAGTDGLFDNLYNNEITAVVVHAMRAGLELQVTAQKIAALARQRAQDKDRQTPFSTAAQDAGFRYYGGKLDDITVVVSHITISRNEIQTSL